jgi:peptidoglycan/xylan/chitin deacetylase (PgdA/CDA1 family)
MGATQVIMTFDDGWKTVYDNAFPIMQKNSQPGVAFVITEPLVGAGYTDYMKTPELSTMYAANWDISSHTYSHTVLTTITNDTLLDHELIDSKSWLDSMGFRRGAMFLAYPEGQFNQHVIDRATLAHYYGARTINFSTYNSTPTDLFNLSAYEQDGSNDNGTSIINVINSTQGLVILAFHKVVPTLTANSSTEISVADFTLISDYLKNNSIPVITLSQYFSPPLTTIYQPSPPQLSSSSSGNNWINLSWAPATGNNADFYRLYVNSILVSTQTTLSYNLTSVIPNIPYNMQVYSVNTTNGNIFSLNPLSLNLSANNYAPPTPLLLSQNITDNILNISYSPGIGNVSDFYNINVNNIWHNNTNATFINIPTTPHEHIVASIYAINSTYLASGYALLVDVIVPNSEVDIRNGIWADYDVFIGDTLTIRPVVFNSDNDTLFFTTNATNATINSSSGEFILKTSNYTSGLYHYFISVTDNIGNSSKINFNVSVSIRPAPYKPSNSGGGSSSISSGGSPEVFDPNSYFNERLFTFIKTNVTTKVRFSKNNLITNVTLEGSRNYGDVTFRVTLLKGNPISFVSGEFKFFKITLDNIQEENEHLYIHNASFIVNLTETNHTGITFYHYTNKTWVSIPYTRLSNTTYLISTPTLSNFLIASPPPIETPITETISLSTIPPETVPMLSTISETATQVKESLYRMILNFLKKYMWWV